jgi:hypothetical protein
VLPLRALREWQGPKIALPQDEFVYTDLLCEFLADIGVTDILSAGSAETSEQIYRAALPQVRLGRKLTGYLEEDTLVRIGRLASEVNARDIDVSYRAWHAEAWLGQHGYRKLQIADETIALIDRYPQLRFDISTEESAVFTGDDWYRFLLRSRCALGVEGGASVLDRDGSLAARTRAYVTAHPEADFADIREACFAGQDGAFSLFAVGPRHLEACATRTCQLLVEGEFQGILRAGVDYIPISRDFSNLPRVLDLVADRDPAIETTAERAYRRVVASGRYTYRSFVKQVESEILLRDRRIWSLSMLSRVQSELVSDAVDRHERISSFALTEALEFLPHRMNYEHSGDSRWQQARAKAQALADETGIILDPDWGLPSSGANN